MSGTMQVRLMMERGPGMAWHGRHGGGEGRGEVWRQRRHPIQMGSGHAVVWALAEEYRPKCPALT